MKDYERGDFIKKKPTCLGGQLWKVKNLSEKLKQNLYFS